jgi:membrane protein DedA with SNARE-associated domain
MGMAADEYWLKRIRERRLAEAHAAIKVPFNFHEDSHWTRFLEGCPANPAKLALALQPPFGATNLAALSNLSASYGRSASRPTGRPQNTRMFVTSLIDPLISFVSAHAGLAYLTLFLAALLEAVPVVGSVIPGSTIIFALSALVPGGELKLEWVLAAAAAGALLGDGSAFWLGHREQRGILNAWPLSRYPRVVAQSEAFFHRWGTLAVFFARFVPPIRALVPMTAGALGMSPPLFYAVNIPAILLWAPAHVLPGVLAVSALHRYGGFAPHAGIARQYWILAVIAGALIIAASTWVIQRRRGDGADESAGQPDRSKL